MKLNIDLKKTLAVGGLMLASSMLSLQAGVKEVAAPAPVAEEETSWWKGSLSAGYDSKYIFRGTDFSGSDGLVWTNLAVTLFDHVNLAAWYADVPSGDYGELDLTASLTYSVGIVDLSGGLIWYYFTEDDTDDTFEPFVSANVNIGEYVDWLVYAGYDTEEDGFYFYTSVSAPIPVTDWLTLTPLAGIGYGVDYYSDKGDSNSDFNQVDLRLTAAFKLSKTVTLSPYIAAVFPLDNIESQDDNVYGGASLSVSF